MPKLTIMRGLPASGKSTKSAELLKVGNTVRVNKDLLRTMLHCDKFSRSNEDITYKASRVLVEMALLDGMNIIIDDTNLNPLTVKSWVKLAQIYGAKIEYIDCFDVSVEECINRDDVREKKVGRHVIQKMALQYLDYFKGDNAIICDLDGTLCNIDHRLHFAQSTPKDWKGFFEMISGDSVRTEVCQKINKVLFDFPMARLIFVTARPENYRDLTEEWLKAKGFFCDALIMREAHDKRPDTEVKSDIYEKYLKKMNIIKVFDDRPSVIRMWREKGLDVEDVGKGIEF